MARDFQSDLKIDGVPDEKIQVQVRRSKDRMTSAPLLILLSLEMTEMDVYPDAKRNRAEYMMAVQSTANAGMQIMLAAHAEGLGSVWICSPLFTQETIKAVLSLPDTWEPQGMLFIGYPDVIPDLRSRKGLEEITLYK